MRPIALGYVGFRAGDLQEWRAYGTRHLGFQVVDRSGGSVAFRMDDRKRRVMVEADGGKGIKFLGWEAADAAALDAIAARIEAAGVRLERVPEWMQQIGAVVQYNGDVISRTFHGTEEDLCAELAGP